VIYPWFHKAGNRIEAGGNQSLSHVLAGGKFQPPPIFSCHTALIVGHAMSNGHGSDPIDQSLRAEWLMMVDRTVGRVGFVLQFALGIYMNLSYPGCLEARDAPAVRPSTICPAEERFGCLQGAAMGWKHGM